MQLTNNILRLISILAPTAAELSLREKRFVAWLEKKEDAEGFSVRDLFV
jgi:hypothetical protein